MGWVKLQDSTLTSIAGSIRNKLGVQTQYLPSAMPAAIDSIPTGGGGVLDKTVTFVVDGVDYAVYSVPAGKSIFEPAPPTKSGFYFAGWGTTSSASSFRTFPYTPTLSEETLYANWIAGTEQVCIVSGLGSSSSSIITETDFPFSYEEWTDARGNIFVKIPTLYRKIVTVASSQITGYILSTIKHDDDYHPYSCFVAPDGETILPYVCIGKYCSSSITECNSVDATPVAQTIGNGRTNARAVGTGYQLYDWQMQKLFVDLALAQYKNPDFNNGRLITNYLGIYHLDNTVFVDGVCTYKSSSSGTGTTWVVATNPDNYRDSATSSSQGYVAPSYSVSRGSSTIWYVNKLGYDANIEFFNYPSYLGSSSANYYDVFYFEAGSAGSRPVKSVVGTKTSLDGLWRTEARESWSGTGCVRLCYRPISA